MMTIIDRDIKQTYGYRAIGQSEAYLRYNQEYVQRKGCSMSHAYRDTGKYDNRYYYKVLLCTWRKNIYKSTEAIKQ